MRTLEHRHRKLCCEALESRRQLNVAPIAMDASHVTPAADGDGTGNFATVTADAQVNHAPVNQLPSALRMSNDQLLLLGGRIHVSDSDNPDEVDVTLDVTHGVLKATANTPGPLLEGSGTSHLHVRGTLTAVNAVLDSLAFAADRGYLGDLTLDMLTSDMTQPSALTDSDRLSITSYLATWHNSVRPNDVNGDRRISAADAQLIVKELLLHGPRPLSNLIITPFAATVIEVEVYGAILPYLDVNADNRLSATDALLVISALLHPAAAPAARLATIATESSQTEEPGTDLVQGAALAAESLLHPVSGGDASHASVRQTSDTGPPALLGAAILVQGNTGAELWTSAQLDASDADAAEEPVETNLLTRFDAPFED